jgi:hypothetical protein
VIFIPPQRVWRCGGTFSLAGSGTFPALAGFIGCIGFRFFSLAPADKNEVTELILTKKKKAT